MDEQDIKIRDKEAELAGLKAECVVEAETLTTILKSINSVRSELIDIDKKKVEFDQYVIEKTILLKEESDRIIAERGKISRLMETSDVELKRLSDLIKVANKDLSLANSRVFKAMEEHKDFEAKKVEIVKHVSGLDELVKLLPGLQSDILQLEEQRNKVKSEISEMLNSSSLELQKAKEELSKIEKEVLLKISEANQAEYRCKKYVDELYTHMNDYETVKKRLEDHWDKTFPDLALKI